MIRDSIPTLFSAADWDDRIEGAWYTLREEIARGQINSYADLVTWLESQLARVVNQSTWRGSFVMTWQKLLSHLKRFPRSFPGLIAPAGPGRDLPWSELTSGSVFIIDIQMLSDRGQRLVFGRCVSSISDILEREESQLDAVVVFVDELNKFAPAGSYRSPLKERLIDITARGRSIGLVLFGAEQFASSVDKEIIENSSTYLFGRTESSELRAPNYAALTDEMKAKLTMLPQGHLLARFAKFPQPIFVRFPYPPCIPGDQFGTIAVS